MTKSVPTTTPPATAPMATWIDLVEAGARAGASFPLQCAESLGRIARWQAEWLAAATSLASASVGVTAAPTELAKGLTERAVLAEDNAGWAHAVSAAVVETIDAVRLVGEGAVQLHGGMGVTEELSLGGQFKRGLAIAATLGSKSQHLARHAELA